MPGGCITDLSERELKRPRGTEPLKGIIDRLNKEEKIPYNIIVSMQNLNSLSTFGAHPKDFNPRQVKPVLLDLTTVLEWYIKYQEEQSTIVTELGVPVEIMKKQTGAKRVNVSTKKRILLILFISVLLICAAIVVTLVTTGVIKSGKNVSAAEIKSLVVLPFENYTGDEHLDYVADGMHASLIGDMGKLGALRVIGETSSNVYKNTPKSAPDIARELHVDALVEPTVTCYGDSVCIQIRVITPFPEEKQLWVADYREDKSEMMNLFNRITKQIASEIMIKLTPEEEHLLARSVTVDRDAYDDYLKAGQYLGDLGKESLQKALKYFNNAIEKEPDWAPLYSGIAQVWLGIQQNGYEPTSVTSPEIYKNLNKALELDPNLSEAHFLKASIAQLMEWDWEKSESEFLKALAVNPNDALSRVSYAQLLCILQRTDEGIAQGRLALNLDPLNPMIKCLYGAILPCAGDCKTALSLAEEITATDPGHYLANNVILFAALRCKEYNKVIKAERYLLPLFNVKEEDIKEIERIFNEQGIVNAYEKIMKHLEEFAEKNPISFSDMASRYIVANQPEKAMDWIEKGFEMHDPQMIYLATKMYNIDPLFKNPRFIAIVKKMNLPLPKD
jgi:TolB-like protein